MKSIMYKGKKYYDGQKVKITYDITASGGYVHKTKETTGTIEFKEYDDGEGYGTLQHLGFVITYKYINGDIRYNTYITLPDAVNQKRIK
jgi:hypothetical protein